ncbi:Galactosylgalactosylxylosyl 3-beta-glucuronosyltransferase 3 [Brachionus plicatilis]|uniref:Galactosylgalactosylxylosylprotein 3-beta-glucuronosyltransferase n=1 Tax=Brachionus plicatilis TaxID=10195 RepID=A0A3M7SZF6_BRAPC|nr:Galactosylgalactosylxylosyl 3-beta-glucuronosyltransferase 3 [Brachionus plicatilis]
MKTLEYVLVYFGILILLNQTNENILANDLIYKSQVKKKIENCQKIHSCKYFLRFVDIYDEMPTIYIITPTYLRETQMADLTRLRNTLLLVPKIVWIIVEDSLEKSDKISSFAMESNLNIVHLAEKTLKLEKPSKYSAHKGVEQRNRGIYWIKEKQPQNAIVYFADDDNSYSLKLFEDIRSVKKIGVWPVALVGGLKYEAPICNNDKVVDWFYAYNQRRYVPTDMASFAINVQLLYQFDDSYFERFTKSDLEGSFLKRLNIKVADFEPKAEVCSKIHVWHTRTMLVKIRKGEIVERKI